MAPRASLASVWKALAAAPGILRAKPRAIAFLSRYMRGFRPQRVGRNIILHSHLPPLNSRAYRRFVDEHIAGRSEGPSHAQVAVTDKCPQRCAYCYNRGRVGAAMDATTLRRVVRELRELGVFWLGFTGGEPLLNRDLVGLTEEASRDCAVKLFTTGCGLTEALAADLRDAGLFSVSVSLDHWTEAGHDAARGYPGAFRAAMRALELFRSAGRIQVGVSAVLSEDLYRPEAAERLLRFLEGLGVDEAWLSEIKPSTPAYWRNDRRITDGERKGLEALQDRFNRRDGMTVNYLAHFESETRFGCNAGRKMVYVDAFGEVGPCVFAPLSFGNVRNAPLAEICRDMAAHFKPAGRCFMNENYRLFRGVEGEGLPLSRERSAALAKNSRFGPPPAIEVLLRG